MKHLILTITILTLMISSTFARENISPEEHSTVFKLSENKIVHNTANKENWELNEPISTIDALSLTIKTKSKLEEQIFDLQSQIDLLKLECSIGEFDFNTNDNDYQTLENKLHELKKENNLHHLLLLVLIGISVLI